jgi:hypothetical protein
MNAIKARLHMMGILFVLLLAACMEVSVVEPTTQPTATRVVEPTAQPTATRVVEPTRVVPTRTPTLKELFPVDRASIRKRKEQMEIVNPVCQRAFSTSEIDPGKVEGSIWIQTYFGMEAGDEPEVDFELYWALLPGQPVTSEVEDATALVCVARVDNKVKKCSYTSGEVFWTTREEVTVAVVDLVNDKVLGRNVFDGGRPPNCPSTIESRSPGSLSGTDYFSREAQFWGDSVSNRTIGSFIKIFWSP